MLDNLKRLIISNGLAPRIHRLRERIELMQAAVSREFELGTLANDFLATMLISQICAPKRTFIDVGAHIGSVISAVRTYVPSAMIVAVEAIPEKADHLKRKFPQIDVHQVALGNADGNVKFYVDVVQSGYSSLSRPAERDSAKIVEINVRMTSLDKLPNLTAVDAIKIDVEGAELEVLRGGIGTINKNRPIIMYESGPSANGQLDAEKAPQWQFFRDNNYVLVVPNRLAHNDVGLSKEGYMESHLYPRRTTNYFAIPSERMLEYRSRARGILSVA